jgi:hypothetical protein
MVTSINELNAEERAVMLDTRASLACEGFKMSQRNFEDVAINFANENRSGKISSSFQEVVKQFSRHQQAQNAS